MAQRVPQLACHKGRGQSDCWTGVAPLSDSGRAAASGRVAEWV